MYPAALHCSLHQRPVRVQLCNVALCRYSLSATRVLQQAANKTWHLCLCLSH